MRSTSSRVLLFAAVFAAMPTFAQSGGETRFTDEASFLSAFGQHAIEIAPNVYQIDRGAGRRTVVGFGESAMRMDLARLIQLRHDALNAPKGIPVDASAVDQIRLLDSGIAALENDLKLRTSEGPKVSDSSGGLLCNQGAASVSANAVAGLTYGQADASAAVSVFGPPSGSPPSFTGCTYSAVLLGGSGLVAWGNNNGCDSPINTLGSPRQTDTGWFGPDFCPKSAATSWVSGTGGTVANNNSCATNPNYISVYVEDNPCGLP